MSDSNWTSIREKGGYNAHVQSGEGYEANQRDKPFKAIIGIGLLVVLALVFSRLGPAPHDVSDAPSITTGQTTGSAR